MDEGRIFADKLSRGEQLDIGAVVFAGDYHWRNASWLLKLRVCFFGKRRDIMHLGALSHIRWWRGQPYLVSIREAV